MLAFHHLLYSASPDPGLFNDIKEVTLTYRNGEKLFADLFKEERAISHQNICPHHTARCLCHTCGSRFTASPLGQRGLSGGRALPALWGGNGQVQRGAQNAGEAPLGSSWQAAAVLTAHMPWKTSVFKHDTYKGHVTWIFLGPSQFQISYYMSASEVQIDID